MDYVDYLVLIASLGLISVIGLVKSNVTKNVSTQDRLIGSGVSVWSVTLSVCSGFISSISLLGFPSEIYYTGSMLLWYAVMYCIAFPLVAFIFLPVIYNLRLSTLYEYLERRFDLECRIVGLSLFCLQTLLYNAVALYAPSLAISSLTGIPLNVSICLTALLSAVYISVGGAKAGIITSALQMALIFVSMIIIIGLSLRENSIGEVYASAVNGSRLILNDFRIDPRVRHSVWSLVIGGTGNILCLFAANQLSIQRYMAMPTLKQAQRVVLLNIICNTVILVIYVSIGLLIYNFYQKCDPILISRNELLPRFVADTLSHIPGSVGLFAAAVYSAGISTLSASFSAMSSVIVRDGLKLLRHGKPQLSESTEMRLSKCLPMLLAAVSIFTAIVCSKLQSMVLQIAFSVFGAVGGPVLGSFVVGFFIPFARGKSGVVGLVGSTIVCFVIAIGALVMQLRPAPMPVDATCREVITNVTYVPEHYGLLLPLDGPWYGEIFKVSYQYYSLIGVSVNVLLAVFYQIFFGRSYIRKIDEELLSKYAIRSHGAIRKVEMDALSSLTVNTDKESALA